MKELMKKFMKTILCVLFITYLAVMFTAHIQLGVAWGMFAGYFASFVLFSIFLLVMYLLEDAIAENLKTFFVMIAILSIAATIFQCLLVMAALKVGSYLDLGDIYCFLIYVVMASIPLVVTKYKGVVNTIVNEKQKSS